MGYGLGIEEFLHSPSAQERNDSELNSFSDVKRSKRDRKNSSMLSNKLTLKINSPQTLDDEFLLDSRPNIDLSQLDEK